MGIKITANYLGSKKVELTHDDSGVKIHTTAPKDNQGDGNGFSPTDLAGASLLSCMITLMAIVAERKGIDFDDVTGSVEKFMQENPRRIAKLEIVIELPDSISKQHRAVLERAAHTCPVSSSLGEFVVQQVSFIYR